MVTVRSNHFVVRYPLPRQSARQFTGFFLTSQYIPFREEMQEAIIPCQSDDRRKLIPMEIY